MDRTIRTLLLTGFLTIAIAGCDGYLSTGEQPALFLPPTSAVTSTPAPVSTNVSTPISAVTEEACSNTLVFIRDLTVADGTIFAPGEKIDKRWLVENQGTCNWNSRYFLKFTGGQPMDAKIEQSLVPALSGSQAVVRIIFTAPDEPGKYRSAWQAYTPEPQPFGDPFFIEIKVLSGSRSAGE